MPYDRQNKMTACSDRPFRDNYDRLLFTSMKQTIIDNLDKSDRYSRQNTIHLHASDRLSDRYS